MTNEQNNSDDTPTAMQSQWTHIDKTDNGSLYQLNQGLLQLLHLYGSPRQMGYAEGWLLSNKILEFYGEFTKHLADGFNQGEGAVKTVPKTYQDILFKHGKWQATAETVEEALLSVVKNTRKFTPNYFVEEAKGMAAGIIDRANSECANATLTTQTETGFEKVLGISMFGELVRAGCSIIGANKSATETGDVLQLRALDFDLHVPLISYPLVKVYHPDSADDAGHEFLTFGWAGFIGAVTGYSRFNAISEKDWYRYLPDPENPGAPSDHGHDAIKGCPWNFLLRDIIQFDESLAETRRRIADTRRTCAIYIGVGSHHKREFSTFEYSLEDVKEFKWDTPFPSYTPQASEHPNIKDVVYIDQFPQPSNDAQFSTRISKVLQDRGYLSVTDVKNICREVHTGNIHIAIFDFAKQQLHLAYALPDLNASSGPTPAWQTQNDNYILLDVNALLDEPRENP